MKFVLIGAAALAWVYLLWVLHRAELYFWKFIVGSMGCFILMMLTIQPVMTVPLGRAVACLAGITGTLTNAFTAYYKYSIIFITTAVGSITLKIDFECSGIIETMAFLSLLLFFRLYKPYEKVIIGAVGVAYILVSNALRITLICMVLHFFGPQHYYVMHAIVGRVFFYALSILLYFYVFTRSQVVKTKVGIFTYGAS